MNEEIQRNFSLLKYEIDTLKANQRLFFESQFEILRNLGVHDERIIYFAKKYQNYQKIYHQKDHNIIIKEHEEPTSKGKDKKTDHGFKFFFSVYLIGFYIRV